MEFSKKDIKDKSEEVVKKASGYMLGAVICGSAGVVLGFALRKKILLFGAIGFVAGGYIGHMITEKDSDFSNFSFINSKYNRRRKNKFSVKYK